MSPQVERGYPGDIRDQSRRSKMTEEGELVLKKGKPTAVENKAELTAKDAEGAKRLTACKTNAPPTELINELLRFFALLAVLAVEPDARRGKKGFGPTAASARNALSHTTTLER